MSASKGVLRGLAGWAALATLTGTLAAQAPQPVAAPQAKPAAVVNGEAIDAAEVHNVLKQQPPSPVVLNETQKRELFTTALNMLVDDLLMRQYLRKNGPPVPPADVDKEIKELVTALQKDKTTLADFLKESNQTEVQLRADITSRLQWKGFIMPRLPDNVVKAYYDQNKLFFDKVFVRASHILIKLPPTATPQDRQAAHNKLAAARADILAGKLEFAKAAKEMSDCPSKDNGGDIGPFPYKFAVVEPFAKAAFSMKVGDTSDVVTTEFGLHIIKVTDRNNGQPSDFNAMKDQVREIYAQEVYQNILGDLRKNAKIETNVP